MIRSSVESELYAYGTTVLKNMDCPALTMNGMADHVHVLFAHSRVKTIADVVEELKTSTSKWMKTRGPDLSGFRWQSGYGAFSVSQANTDQVTQYIRDQREHHRARSFQDELRALLVRHNVSFDERYVWD